MAKYETGTVVQRLAGNVYEVDEGNSHIEVNQEVAAATGAGDLLIRVCPAHVYSREADGTIGVEYAACLECGTCLAVAPPGVLTWHYPASSMGVAFREG
ncbi:ferredoxin like protein [Arcanobacterium wilhelmae]|uniref:Ferredoxin like protein n=1 Tax=Arcanobacterium wilhelmae TaxID=1803177 RepID=A0ABT9NC12_9ACTO|nr:ferredoxin [Arcanobacterium wilhelmae]MDP9800751.1 ferredoxin like protein [Arcanobacterium wilhelmae]